MVDMIIKPRYRYNYTTLKRQDLPEGRRYVNEVGDKLPSVTSCTSTAILDTIRVNQSGTP